MIKGYRNINLLDVIFHSFYCLYSYGNERDVGRAKSGGGERGVWWVRVNEWVLEGWWRRRDAGRRLCRVGIGKYNLERTVKHLNK